MNRNWNTTLLVAMVVSVIVCAGAQAGDRSFGDGTLPDHLAIYDVDGDGVLSVEEIQAMKDVRRVRHHEWLEQWDLNGDGIIDEEERAAAHDALRVRIEDRRTERFDEADTDGDGCLSFEEFSAIPAVMELAVDHPELPALIFDRLDADDDDCVSLDEFLAHLGHQRHDGWRTAETYAAADVDGDGCLTLAEFSAIPEIALLAQVHPSEPARIYDILDVDDNDCLTLEEFTADVHLGVPYDEWRTPEAFAAADLDDNGCLTLAEFSTIPEMVLLAQVNPDGPAHIYDVLDVDDNDCLTLDEFTADSGHQGPPGGGY